MSGHREISELLTERGAVDTRLDPVAAFIAAVFAHDLAALAFDPEVVTQTKQVRPGLLVWAAARGNRDAVATCGHARLRRGCEGPRRRADRAGVGDRVAATVANGDGQLVQQLLAWARTPWSETPASTRRRWGGRVRRPHRADRGPRSRHAGRQLNTVHRAFTSGCPRVPTPPTSGPPRLPNVDCRPDQGEPDVNKRARRRGVLTVVAAVALFAAACGDDSGSGSATTAAGGRQCQHDRSEWRQRSEHNGGRARVGHPAGQWLDVPARVPAGGRLGVRLGEQGRVRSPMEAAARARAVPT